MEILTSLLEILGVLLIVALNGCFVAAEFAIVKVRTTQIEPLVRKGSKRAEVAYNVVTHLDAYLSATQLGITMTSLALGWLGEPYVADMLFPVFSLVGIVQPAIISTVSFAVAFSIITFIHIVLGELAPKWIAIQHPQRIALALAFPLNVFFSIFRPFIWLLNRSANYFLKVIGIQTAGQTESAHSDDELRLLLSKGKSITGTAKSISLRAMDFRERTVREVMVPRTSVTYLSTDKSIEQNIAIALENQFTRYPLCEKNLDNILGMIHLKDLFKLKGAQGDGTKLLGIKREMLFVPETGTLEKALSMFLSKRVLMAIAVDEYGGTAGLVTLENVLEELVGDIRDEFDVEPLMVQKVSDSEFVVDGALPLHDFAKMFNVVPDSRDVVTLSGYAIQLLGGVPKEGAALRMGDWNAIVEGTEARKVRRIRLRKVTNEPEKP